MNVEIVLILLVYLSFALADKFVLSGGNSQNARCVAHIDSDNFL